MNQTPLNRWDDAPIQAKPKGAFQTVMAVGVKLLALPRGAQLAIAVVSLILLAGLTGTILGWLFRLMALLGIGLVLFLVLAYLSTVLNRKK
jgi:hypothetical protein